MLLCMLDQLFLQSISETEAASFFFSFLFFSFLPRFFLLRHTTKRTTILTKKVLRDAPKPVSTLSATRTISSYLALGPRLQISHCLHQPSQAIDLVRGIPELSTGDQPTLSRNPRPSPTDISPIYYLGIPASGARVQPAVFGRKSRKSAVLNRCKA